MCRVSGIPRSPVGSALPGLPVLVLFKGVPGKRNDMAKRNFPALNASAACHSSPPAGARNPHDETILPRFLLRSPRAGARQVF